MGSEYLHLAIEDASRRACTAPMPEGKKAGAVRFPADALARCAAHGGGVERVMTDNGSAFESEPFAAALQDRGRKHAPTRPCIPRTNGEAERLIQASLREWAYASPFHTSAERARAMPARPCRCNSLRPHSALAATPPISRLTRDNRLGSDS